MTNKAQSNSAWRRWGSSALFSFLVLLLAVGGLVRWGAMSPWGHRLVERQINTRTLQGQSFQIEGLSGDLFRRFHLHRLKVSDADGVWIDAERLNFEWSPLALLARRIEIREVSADRLALTRIGTFPPGKPASSSSASVTIPNISLRTLSLPMINIGAEIAGEPRIFSLTADGIWQEDQRHANLTLVPDEEDGDRINIDMAWSTAGGLNGMIEGYGPPGGVFTRLLNLDGNGPLRLNARGSMETPDAFTGYLTVALGAETLAEAAGTWSPETLSGEAEIDFTTIPQFQAIAARLGGPIHVKIDTPKRDLVKAALSTAHAEVALQTPFDIAALRHRAGEIEITARSEDITTLTGVTDAALTNITYRGRLSEIGGAWSLSGQLDARKFRYDAYQFAALNLPHKVTYRPTHGALSVTAEGALDRLSTGTAELDAVIGAAPTLQLIADYNLGTGGLTLTNALLTGANAYATASGDANTQTGAVGLSGSYAFNDRTGTGPVKAAGSWRASGPVGDLTLALNGRLDGLATLAADLAPYLQDGLTFAATATVGTRGLTAARATIDGTGLILRADADLNGEILTANLSGGLTGGDIGPAQFKGATLRARLQGTLDQFAVEASGTLNSLSVAENALGSPKSTLLGAFEAGNFTADVGLSGLTLDAPASMRASISTDGQNWHVANLIADWQGYRLNGTARGELSALEALSARADLTHTPSGKTALPSLDGTFLLQNRTLSANFQSGPVNAGTLILDRVGLTLQGDLDAAEVAIVTAGAIDIGSTRNQLNADIKADLNIAGAQAVSVFEIALDDHRIANETPIKINWADNSSQIATGTVAILGGHLRFDAQETDNDVILNADWRDLSLSTVSALTGVTELNGRAGGSLRLANKGAGLTGFLSARLEDLSGPRLPDETGLALIHATIEPNAAEANVDIRFGENAILNSKARLPLIPPTEFKTISLPEPAGPLTAQIFGDGTLAPFWALIGPPETRLEGGFTLDAQLDGEISDLGSLAPNGTFVLTDGLVEDSVTGLLLRDIDLTTHLQKNGITLQSLSARGAQAGLVSGRGHYAFDGIGDLQITLDRLQPLQRDDISVTLSGTLGVEAEGTQAMLRGDLVIDQGTVDLDKLPDADYVTLDVQFNGEESEPAENLAETIPIGLDISLRADRRIAISGPSLDTEWGTNLNVTGTLADPRFVGEVEIIRGDLDVLGRSFRLIDSNISLNGDPREAWLSLRAERISNGFTALILVTGPATAPRIRFTSDPALPEDEVIARILFGRSVTQLSAVEAAQLGIAIASLSGGGGLNVIGRLESALRLDRLDISVDEAGTPTLATGKYIGNNVYLEIRSSTRGAQSVGVEWTPRPNIEIGADIDAEATPAFRVQWTRSFGTPPKAKTQEGEDVSAPDLDAPPPKGE